MKMTASDSYERPQYQTIAEQSAARPRDQPPHEREPIKN